MADEEHLPGCSALFSTIDGGPFNDSACDCWGERMAVFRAQLKAWETAIDSWMVVNWIGVYERERGVSETLSLCLEKALDVEREELRAQLAARDAEVTRLRDLLSRYYREVPLGHQPHMIAHLAEAALKGEG